MEGLEPTPEFQAAMDLYDEFKLTTDPARQVEIGKELVRMSTENLWTIQTVGLVPNPVVVSEQHSERRRAPYGRLDHHDPRHDGACELLLHGRRYVTPTELTEGCQLAALPTTPRLPAAKRSGRETAAIAKWQPGTIDPA